MRNEYDAEFKHHFSFTLNAIKSFVNLARVTFSGQTASRQDRKMLRRKIVSMGFSGFLSVFLDEYTFQKLGTHQPMNYTHPNASLEHIINGAEPWKLCWRTESRELQLGPTKQVKKVILYIFIQNAPLTLLSQSDQHPKVHWPAGLFGSLQSVFGGGGWNTFASSKVCMTNLTFFWLSRVDFQYWGEKGPL